ncbi:MAG: DNA primase, partial [Clostridia bacterium]|nr:DNA primase [Clostridia bacterium]
MPLIDQSVIEEIKLRANIEDVISSYVQLKRAGSNYQGLCPFHSEKSPSFTVFPGTSSFYCFGCGAGGDVIHFVRRAENMDYPSAVEFLAKRYGIPITLDKKEQAENARRERVLAMNKEAARFFHQKLFAPEGAEGLRYLTENRRLPLPLIRHFGLGFAPNVGWSLTDHLRKKGYTDSEMASAFLCGISQKTGKPYDYFRNRVIFPIIDVRGDVVAFGGRVMDDSKPKYLNSSDTPAFKKSRNLFALNFARKSENDTMILCEGYMDVIALHGAGFSNAVATLGTAITPEQARIFA